MPIRIELKIKDIDGPARPLRAVALPVGSKTMRHGQTILPRFLDQNELRVNVDKPVKFNRKTLKVIIRKASDGEEDVPQEVIDKYMTRGINIVHE